MQPRRFALIGHKHSLTDLVDFPEAVEDAIGSILVDSTSIDFTYTDATPAITATVKPEFIQDTVGAMLTDSATVDFTYTDGGVDVGTFTAATIPAGILAQLLTVDGAGSGLDADLLDGLNSTAFTLASTLTEDVQDIVGAFLVDSTTIDFTYSDGGNSITVAVIPGGVDHNALLNFVANKHIDHTAVTLTAGAGLTGGGDISASRTFAVGAGTGITVNADDIQIATTYQGANPSATIGLTAVNGTATTTMRSDAAPALSQAIVPTWTETHTWTDNDKVVLGTGSDLSIWHDGTDSNIENDTGALLFKGAAGAERMRITSGGSVQIGTSSGTAYGMLLFNNSANDALLVRQDGAGNIQEWAKSSGTVVGRFSTTQLGLLDGTAAAPALSFINDLNTGLYSNAADSIGLSVGGLYSGALFRASLGAFYALVSDAAGTPTDRGYIGASGTTNSVITGSAVGDVLLRGNGVAILFSVDSGSTTHTKMSSTSLTLSTPLTTKGYTVAALPAGVTGMLAHVTDALTPTFGATAVGGGAVKLPVFYNGTNWVTI